MPGRVEALTTMSLMQMIADAYEDAYDMRKDHTGPRPSPSSRNEAQEVSSYVVFRIRDNVLTCNFLDRLFEFG